MGWKYEVSVWLPDTIGGRDYRDIVVYGGRSLIRAIIAIYKWRKKCGCVTFKCR